MNISLKNYISSIQYLLIGIMLGAIYKLYSFPKSNLYDVLVDAPLQNLADDNILLFSVLYVFSFIIFFFWIKGARYEGAKSLVRKRNVLSLFGGILLFFTFHDGMKSSYFLFYIILIVILVFMSWKRRYYSKSENIPNPFRKIRRDSDSPLNTIRDLNEVRGSDSSLFRSFLRGVEYLSERLTVDSEGLAIDGAYVFCLDASWGSGKTSFLNIVREKVYRKDNHPIWIEYNPWRFSSRDELIYDFFANLENRFFEEYGYGFGQDLQRYVELISSKSEDSKFGLLWNSFRFLFGMQNQTLDELKNKISVRLRDAKPKKKIVVVLDDVDRMELEEIMHLLKLVKVISDFPNVIFILSMDYEKISMLIGNKYREGYGEYMQKIVQERLGLNSYNYLELKSIFEKHFMSECKDLFDRFLLKVKSKKIQKLVEGDWRRKPDPTMMQNPNFDERDSDFKYRFFKTLFFKIVSKEGWRILYNSCLSQYLHEKLEFIIDSMGDPPSNHTIGKIVEDIISILVVSDYIDQINSILKGLYRDHILKNVFNIYKEHEVKGEDLLFRTGNYLIEDVSPSIVGDDYLSINKRRVFQTIDIYFGKLENMKGRDDTDDNVKSKLTDIIGEKEDFKKLVRHKIRRFQNDFKESLPMKKNRWVHIIEDWFMKDLVTPRDLKRFATFMNDSEDKVSWEESIEVYFARWNY